MNNRFVSLRHTDPEVAGGEASATPPPAEQVAGDQPAAPEATPAPSAEATSATAVTA